MFQWPTVRTTRSRRGLKRELEFALRSQGLLPSSLGRTRSRRAKKLAIASVARAEDLNVVQGTASGAAVGSSFSSHEVCEESADVTGKVCEGKEKVVDGKTPISPWSRNLSEDVVKNYRGSANYAPGCVREAGSVAATPNIVANDIVVCKRNSGKSVMIGNNGENSSEELMDGGYGSLSSSCLKKLKKNPLKMFPDDVNELLSIGLLQGLAVKYICDEKHTEFKGVVKGGGISCFCSSCNGSTVVSADEFVQHGGSTKMHPAAFIYLDNGNCLHDVVKACTCSSLNTLETTIQDIIAEVSQNINVICQKCKESYVTQRIGMVTVLCNSCLESKKLPREGISSTSRHLGMHKLVFQDGNLPEGTEVNCVVRKETVCQHCLNNWLNQRHFESSSNAKAIGRVQGVDPIEQIRNKDISVVPTAILDDSPCTLCKGYEFSTSSFDDHTIILCDLCDKEYHIKCLRDNGIADLKEVPVGKWFCSTDCKKTWTSLLDFLDNVPEQVTALETVCIRRKCGEKGLKIDIGDLKWRLLSGKNSSEENKVLLSSAREVISTKHGIQWQLFCRSRLVLLLPMMVMTLFLI